MVEQRVVAVERDQRCRIESGELADQFGADRPAGTGDEHARPGDEAAHGFGVDVDDPAIQDVLVAIARELPRASFSDQTLHGGHDERLETCVVHDGVQAPEFLTRCRRHGEQHRLGAVLGGEPLEVVRCAFDSQRSDAVVAHGGVVVDQGDRAVQTRADCLHGGDGPVAAVACSEHDDGHLVEVGRHGDALGANPAEVAMAEHQADRERRRQHQDLPGATFVGDDELDGDQQCADEACGDRNGTGLVEAEALEVTPVEPGRVADDELSDHGNRCEEGRGCLERIVSVEARCDRKRQWPDQQI